jgi:hypothetical protein
VGSIPTALTKKIKGLVPKYLDAKCRVASGKQKESGQDMVEEAQLDKIAQHLCEQLPQMVKLANVDGSLTTPPNYKNFKLEPEAVRPVVILALRMAKLLPPPDVPPLP